CAQHVSAAVVYSHSSRAITGTSDTFPLSLHDALPISVHSAPRTSSGRPETLGGTMRGYALLLGITLTIGYAYAGQVALTSVETANRHASLAERADKAPGPLYFGGTLAPVMVEATATTG